MPLELVNRDPVSDKWRYYNTDTKLFQLSDAAPTQSQVKEYVTANPATPPEKWWGPIPGYTYPPDPPLEKADTAQAAATATDRAPTPAVTDGGPVTDQESKNITDNTDPNYGNYGEEVQESLQETADDTVGAGKVTVGKPTISGIDNDTPTNPTPDIPNKKPITNLLHSFANHTYGLSLHLLDKKQYNDMVKNPTGYTPTNVLIASAGRNNSNNFVRNKRFAEDFYFEEFDLTTMIAPNMHSRNTNAVEGSFTLIEPYGFTFIERLIMASQDLGIKNYLDNPYLLQIDFFAMNDQGVIEEGLSKEILPPKRIPVKITKVDAKVGAKGSEYKIGIVPFWHSAYDVTTVTTPVTMEITARTVAEFFQSLETETAFTEADQREKEFNSSYELQLNRLATQQQPGTAVFLPSILLGSNSEKYKNILSTNRIYSVKSYGTALNAWHDYLKNNNKIGVQDVYKFTFDPEIGNAAFVDSNRNSPKDTPMASDRIDQITMRRGNLSGTGVKTYDSTAAIFQVNAGTTVEKTIETIVKLSEFSSKQVINPEDPDYGTKVLKYANEPYYYHKVTVKVELNDFDEKRNMWARTITYHVGKYEMRNLSSSLAPQGIENNPVKAYNYIYTGKNDDIIDFNIEFNALYFNAITAFKSKLVATNQEAGQQSEEKYQKNSPDWSGSGGTLEPNSVMPLVMKPTVANPRSAAAGGAINSQEVAVNDLVDSFQVANKADMLNVHLKIIGDPDFIKQDDIFYGPETAAIGAGLSADDRKLANGSLHMDQKEVYVQLSYRTPIDLDETTGMMKFDSQYVMSIFSGLYKIIKIKNMFSQGMFTQDLDLVRLPRQGKFDYVGSKNNSTLDQRKEPTGKIGISQNPTTGADLGAVQETGSPPSPGSAIDDAVSATGQQQAEDANVPTNDVQTFPLPEAPPIEQKDLMAVSADSPTQLITDQTTPQTVAPAVPPESPIVASPGAVFDGISAEELQYIRSQSAALGLNPAALNGYLTNRLQDYPPNLRAKVAADTVKLKEILRKRNQ